VTAPPGEKKEFPGFEMLNAELVEFGRCIREKQAFPVKIDEVLHGISVFEAIVEASRTGRVVEVVDR
ncbi:MAG: hypothetical protein IT538_00335, partial [Variibacter sp.]|nr:hypothetical protein [Variibacter sp.]